MKTFEGAHDATGLKIAIVASRFNEQIIDGLLAGALDCLRERGARDDSIELYRVPGAFEIPLVAAELAESGRFDAIVTIGCLVKGDTIHFEVLSSQVTNELSRVAVDTAFPIAFGVITCTTWEQAVERSSKGSGNKGAEAALAAIEMANLWRQIRNGE